MTHEASGPVTPPETASQGNAPGGLPPPASTASTVAVPAESTWPTRLRGFVLGIVVASLASWVLLWSPSLELVASFSAVVLAFVIPAVLVACVAFYCLQDRVWRQLGLGDTNEFVEPLLSGAEALQAGDTTTAKPRLKASAQALLRRYASAKTVAWSVWILLALAGSFVGAVSTMLTAQQNKLLQQQNALVSVQADVAKEQAALLRTQNEIVSREDKEGLLWDLYQSEDLGVRQAALAELLSWGVRQFPGVALEEYPAQRSLRIRNAHGMPVKQVGSALLDLSGRSRFSLAGVDFQRAVFGEVTFEGADLKESNFTDARFSTANFRGADLSQACLRKAGFGRADFRGATLKAANLTNTSLTSADFREADLEGANFARADLREADFTGARNIGQANLAYAWIRRPGAGPHTKFPEGFTADDAVAKGAVVGDPPAE